MIPLLHILLCNGFICSTLNRCLYDPMHTLVADLVLIRISVANGVWLIGT